MIEVEVDERTPMIFYGGGEDGEPDDPGVLAFVRLCPNCARFVKADDAVKINGFEEVMHEPNATCSKCGRVEMIFDGWWEKE